MKRLVLLVTLLVTPVALAQTGLEGPDAGRMFLSTGLLVSASKRPGEVTPGIGAELSIHGYPSKGLGVGVFGQWQSMELEHHRFASGMQFSYSLAGFELGAAHERGTGERAATTLLHVAPYASIGVATLALRFGIPLHTADNGLPGYGYDVGLTLALKVPLPLQGP